MIKIEIHGLDDLISDIEQAERDLASGEIFEAAARTHRMVLVPAAKAEAPKVTGNLASSITSRIADGTLTLEAGADYAGFVHDGTVNQSANPFLDRAVRRTNADLQKRIATETAKRFR